MKMKPIWTTSLILAIGGGLAALILLSDGPHGGRTESNHGEAHAGEEAREAEVRKGPHGGRLFSEGDFAVEITIFEQGVSPEFRVYPFEHGRPVDPALVDLRITLERLGSAPEPIAFQKASDFLRGDTEVVEPHSFKVSIDARHKGQTYRWTYAQAEARVRMDDLVAGQSGIEVKIAGPATLRTTMELPGEIKFNRDRFAHVVPRLAGVVKQSTKDLGDQVRQGELLAVLESQTLADLRSEYLAAQTRRDLARANFERERRLRDRGISAEQEFFAARQALAEIEITHRTLEQKLLALGFSKTALASDGRNGLTRYEIRAPIDGTVLEKHVAVGEAIKDDTTMFVLADLTTVWADMTVYMNDLNVVKAGQKVTVRAPALNANAEARISYVGSLVGERTRAAQARIVLPNGDGRWRPGLFITVEVVREETEVAVAVPVGAVQTYRDWQVVFGRFGDQFEARPVKLGRTDGRWVEIVDGLSPGTRYAATNSFVLKADLGKAGAAHDH